jgi:alginate O-acetyltransferase complex protein AlgI
MLFCTHEYLFFFAGIFTAYWLLPWRAVRVWLLLGASYYFYYKWNPQLAFIVLMTTLMDYAVARGMDVFQKPSIRRLLLLLSLVVNLGLLCYFKYANFFLDSLHDALRAAGLPAWSGTRLLDVILPIGISFYTFEAINYTVDVYRRRIRAERNLSHFVLFILFFPHLVAGPIVRAKDFLPQVRRRKQWDWARMHLGAQFVLMGLFKKMAIADKMAEFADPIFADPGAFRSNAVWMGALAYAIQIYCDFSGYSDMAIGSAHMLGYRLTRNFNMPYLAVNVSDFWRRWHISLSSWLRDYLFVPLGGSRGSNWQTCRNLFVTMALGGLWHGANWTFVIWGCLHGGFNVIHRGFKSFCEPRERLSAALLSFPGTALRMAVTFLAVLAGWVLFRSTSLATAMSVYHRMLVPSDGKGAPLPGLSLFVLVLVLAVGHWVGATGMWRRWSERAPAAALGTAYAVALNLAFLLAPDGGKTFIYFQF